MKKKSYRLLVIWILAFCAGSVLLSVCLDKYLLSMADVADIIFAWIILMVDLLLYMIYKGEYVYWISGGPSYEEAKAAGSEKRKSYARAHLKAFLICTVWLGIYGAAGRIFHFGWALDTGVFCISIIAACAMTIPVKFQKEEGRN